MPKSDIDKFLHEMELAKSLQAQLCEHTEKLAEKLCNITFDA